MLAGLTARRWRVQHFATRARPFGHVAVAQVTGLPGRHLDHWLMDPQVCREVFARGAQHADLALVEGTLEEISLSSGHYPYVRPGRLGPIAEALDLPKVALLECRTAESLHLPRLPRQIDAILIDGLENREDFEAIRRTISLLLKKPVLGAVEALPDCRAALAASLPDQPIPIEVLGRLGASFLQFADLAALRSLSESRLFPGDINPAPPRGGRRFRVAYAQDEAFGGYFPDTLETLEALGAELVEFSPLRDEALPEAVDLVMIGCGFPDRYAEPLAENHCLITALRAHVCQGHRIYAEGGGTAYLGRSMILDGRRVPGAGILPFDAELRAHPRGPYPVRRVLTGDGWLGPAGTEVRGYHSGRWKLRPAPDPCDCPARSGTLTRQGDIYFRRHAVGSLIHLHLASLPEVVRAFVGPPQPYLVPPRAHH